MVYMYLEFWPRVWSQLTIFFSHNCVHRDPVFEVSNSTESSPNFKGEKLFGALVEEGYSNELTHGFELRNV